MDLCWIFYECCGFCTDLAVSLMFSRSTIWWCHNLRGRAGFNTTVGKSNFQTFNIQDVQHYVSFCFLRISPVVIEACVFGGVIRFDAFEDAEVARPLTHLSELRGLFSPYCCTVLLYCQFPIGVSSSESPILHPKSSAPPQRTSQNSTVKQ